MAYFEGEEMSDKIYDKQPEMNINTNSNYTAVIKTNLGDMTVEFFTDDAPITVNNFISLSKDGYYDNVIFHRVISGFMIQGALEIVNLQVCFYRMHLCN